MSLVPAPTGEIPPNNQAQSEAVATTGQHGEEAPRNIQNNPSLSTVTTGQQGIATSNNQANQSDAGVTTEQQGHGVVVANLLVAARTYISNVVAAICGNPVNVEGDGVVTNEQASNERPWIEFLSFGGGLLSFVGGLLGLIAAAIACCCPHGQSSLVVAHCGCGRCDHCLGHTFLGP